MPVGQACQGVVIGQVMGALLGPPKSEHVLEGIRFDLLRELCEEVGIA